MTNTDMSGGGSPSSASAGPDSSGGSPIDTAKQVASQVQGTVMQEAAQFASSAQDKVKEEANRRKETATEAINDFASAVRRAADELSQNDRSTAGQMISKAADGLEGLARTLSEKRPEELLQDVRAFGRSNPVAFAAGAALVGVALGRFLRSSTPDGATSGQGSMAGGSLASAAASGGLQSGEGLESRMGGSGGPGPAMGLNDSIGPGPGASASDNPDIDNEIGMQTGMSGTSNTEGGL